MDITREQLLRFRVHAQQLDREPPGEVSTEAAVLDLGVQDTGPDGARWALELRGFAPDPDELFLAWTIRGAPTCTAGPRLPRWQRLSHRGPRPTRPSGSSTRRGP